MASRQTTNQEIQKNVPKREMWVRVPSNAFLVRFFLGAAGRALILGFLGCTILACGTFTYFYSRYSHVIDRKLREGPFANTVKIFAVPESVARQFAGQWRAAWRC
jgi:hypothetical protein